jgi:hypothetical protein
MYIHKFKFDPSHEKEEIALSTTRWCRMSK